MPQNNTKIFNQLEAASNRKKLIYRWILYLILGFFVIYYATPLYVMIVTSFKTMTEIRQGNLFSFPETLRLDSWKEAWLGQDIDAGNVYLKKYFWNSVKMVVPGVIISTILGAINGLSGDAQATAFTNFKAWVDNESRGALPEPFDTVVCDPIDTLTVYLTDLTSNIAKLTLSGDNTKAITNAKTSSDTLLKAVGCLE